MWFQKTQVRVVSYHLAQLLPHSGYSKTSDEKCVTAMKTSGDRIFYYRISTGKTCLQINKGRGQGINFAEGRSKNITGPFWKVSSHWAFSHLHIFCQYECILCFHHLSLFSFRFPRKFSHEFFALSLVDGIFCFLPFLSKGTHHYCSASACFDKNDVMSGHWYSQSSMSSSC